MIGAVSSSSGGQWPSYINREKNAVATRPVSTVVPHRAVSPEIPVQPADAVTPVSVKSSGNVNAVRGIPSGADAAEMAVRARISPAEQHENAASAVSGQDTGEETEAALLPGVGQEEEPSAAQEIREQLEEEQIERQTRAEERVHQLEEAETKREEYARAQEAEEEARAERVAALREAAERGGEETDSEESQEQTGSLQLDHTAALLRNHQMTNLLHAHLTAQAKGEVTAPIDDVMDALFQDGQQRVRFADEEDDSRQKNEPQQWNDFMLQRKNPFAVSAA